MEVLSAPAGTRKPLLPNSPAPNDYEVGQFKKLQSNFAAQFENAFPDKMAPKTVVVVPSLTLDSEILQKIDGVTYYEERMLCLLMLLRMPQTRVVFITSLPIDPVIVDYYLHLLPGITAYHARQRLTLLACFDSSPKSLTQKILERPRLLKRIRQAIPDQHLAHLSCFTVTEAERKLAVALQLPVYGCDPDLQALGNKSNSRKLFRTCSIPLPPGSENLYTEQDLVAALYSLKMDDRNLRKAVVKLNEGFSGDGNAVFSFVGAPETDLLLDWIEESLPQRLQMVAAGMPYNRFLEKLKREGGIAEAFVEGRIKQSPSVQCRINPLGKIDVISTHDQMVGGPDEQVYLGASFPAQPDYAAEISLLGQRIAEELRSYGVLGRFSIDFISIKDGDQWKHFAIEINLRKGGTTHPYLMLEFLTKGTYDAGEGMYYAANGQPRFYLCSDNLQRDAFRGLTPHDLVDIAMCNELLYDGSTQEGVMFHLISTISQYGKVGVVCIGSSPEKAAFYYQKTIDVLAREGGT